MFALGGPTAADSEVAEGGYFVVRMLLARGLAEAADIVVDRGVARGGYYGAEIARVEYDLLKTTFSAAA